MTSDQSSIGAHKLLMEARACLNRSDFAGAIQLLQRARGLDPNSDKILLELASACAMNYDFAAAEGFFEAALRVSSQQIETLQEIGQRWMAVRRFEKAMECFDLVLRESHVPILTYVRVGELLLRLRRMDRAFEVADRVIKGHPEHEGAWLTRGRILRQAKQFDEAEKVLRAVLGKGAYGTEARATAAYELGALLDGQSRFDEAMAAILEAKALMRSQFSSTALNTANLKQARLREMQKGVSEKLLQGWRNFGQTDLQPARRIGLLCGHPRSGTTLLEYVLDSHSQIVSADETSVFQNKAYPVLTRHLSPKTSYLAAMDAMTGRTLRQIRAEYFQGIESFLGQTVGDRCLIDKNPGMTFDIPAMCRVFPESKFLVALRDPRDVCLSCFMQPTPALPDTAPWLTLEGTILHYNLLMGLWAALKPLMAGRAIEIRYEDMVNDLETNARRALDFLGLPWDERVLKFHESAQGKVVRSPTYAEVAKPIYKTRVARCRNYQKYFEPYLEKLAPLLRSFGYE